MIYLFILPLNKVDSKNESYVKEFLTVGYISIIVIYSVNDQALV